jgi:lipoprotein Spr
MIKTIFFTTALSACLLIASAQKNSKQPADKREPRFLEDIEISVTSDRHAPAIVKAAAKQDKVSPVFQQTSPTSATSVEIEGVTGLQLKYALLLNDEVETVAHSALLEVIESWWGTRYQLGGKDRSGIDCSAFTHVLYDTLFKINLPRTSRDQFAALVSVSPTDMKEGDLVFFSSGITISHVGFYLRNNKFVHASTSEGVTISDLGDSYWSKRFVGVGRYDASFIPSTPAKP